MIHCLALISQGQENQFLHIIQHDEKCAIQHSLGIIHPFIQSTDLWQAHTYMQPACTREPETEHMQMRHQWINITVENQ